ncbi:MAG: hypothetical protein LBK53_08520 [Heliobacteriaceae bacterium]|jgi:hypothetical protein|nr:hypothetical protein [Heliobacteriaceae bacterium]
MVMAWFAMWQMLKQVNPAVQHDKTKAGRQSGKFNILTGLLRRANALLAMTGRLWYDFLAIPFTNNLVTNCLTCTAMTKQQKVNTLSKVR